MRAADLDDVGGKRAAIHLIDPVRIGIPADVHVTGGDRAPGLMEPTGDRGQVRLDGQPAGRDRPVVDPIQPGAAAAPGAGAIRALYGAAGLVDDPPASTNPSCNSYSPSVETLNVGRYWPVTVPPVCTK